MARACHSVGAPCAGKLPIFDQGSIWSNLIWVKLCAALNPMRTQITVRRFEAAIVGGVVITFPSALTAHVHMPFGFPCTTFTDRFYWLLRHGFLQFKARIAPVVWRGIEPRSPRKAANLLNSAGYPAA